MNFPTWKKEFVNLPGDSGRVRIRYYFQKNPHVRSMSLYDAFSGRFF